jgi:hypothetical protein
MGRPWPPHPTGSVAVATKPAFEFGTMDYARSARRSVTVTAPPEAVFAALDDPLRLGRHMARPSAAMLGGYMRTTPDAGGGQVVGSVIRVEGSVLGLSLSILEAVVARDPPRRKVWETVQPPRLVVLGCYRLGFEIEPHGDGSHVQAFIDYDHPQGTLGGLLGRIGASTYARWCLDRILEEAKGVDSKTHKSETLP